MSRYKDKRIELIYYEDGIKVTRFKPSWKFDQSWSPTGQMMKGKARKPEFGPKDPT
jgi:hypothetical protein